MNSHFFISPIVITLILLVWLVIGYKINLKNPRKGFWFLCIYVLFSTHFCMSISEDRWVTPRAEVKTYEDFVKYNQNSTFEYHLIELKDKQFIRIRPYSTNKTLHFIYYFYRLFLLNSWIPEYVFDLDGNLVDWTTDNHDDGWYQDRWGRSKQIKKINSEEITTIISK